jgi:hypothetical protein
VGTVTEATDPSRAVQATISAVVVGPGIGKTFTTTTFSDGSFEFPPIVSGDPALSVHITVTPSNQALLAQDVRFIMVGGSTATLIASVAPVTLNVNQGTVASIAPATTQALPSAPVNLSAQVIDNQGDNLHLTPTVLLVGSAAYVTTGGEFVGTGVGSVAITAFWYNGVQSATAVIDVVPSPYGTPPAPPAGASPGQTYTTD